ncbi:MAG TPA: FAD-dependent oxidoreductase [Sphingomicrobium sp.]|nr:FAD-dependent oxidoreductase [Sphingomicrobium sp.]
MSDFDIIIVGGGIAGASLGAEVARARRTLIVEAETQCGYHATGRSAAFWLESYGGAKVALLSAASRAFLERPPTDFAESGFLRRRGAVHLSDGEWPEVPPGVAARRLTRTELEELVPGIRPRWTRALLEPGCADIDVAGLHAAYLRAFRKGGGALATDSRLVRARRARDSWIVELGDGSELSASLLVNAAGAWADPVAQACGVESLGIAPKRRTMVQLRVGRAGLKDLPLVEDAAGTFYFKGESDSSLWLSPHDEIATDPCDAAPDEIDVATAIDRFEGAVDWPVERVERRWAGLRSFAPDRLPVYGFDSREPGFFWCAGQGGFGIQTAPAAARLAASVLLDEPPDATIAHVDPATFSPARFG